MARGDIIKRRRYLGFKDRKTSEKKKKTQNKKDTITSTDYGLGLLDKWFSTRFVSHHKLQFFITLEVPLAFLL